MPANSTIDLVNLDFDLNKSAFISYLQQQSRFKDYNFAGSDMAILLDLFSINYYRHAFFLNMAISEGFVDSAQLFDNVKSHAKELNFVPRSTTSAYANITVSFTATGASQPYIIPKGSTFSTNIKNQNFTFSTPEQIICASANTTFSFTTNIFEGIYVKDSYVFDASSGLPQRFKLTNKNADTSSIVVNVFENGSVLGTNFNQVTSLLDLESTSLVYFLQCASEDGNYEILFGDGVLGYQPKNGSLVVIDYRISQGAAPNGAGDFRNNFEPTGAQELTGPVNIFANQIAQGGAAAQDMESTRFYAPRWFQVQERAIVPTDYEILLKQKFPEIQAVHAYGGETLIPPQFGKVVIAVDISNVQGLPTSKIQQYTNFIKGRNPLSIQPIFISPQFTYIEINTTIRYNINVTTESDNLISSIVANAINQYNTDNLNDFDVTFRLTPFTTFIVNSDPSIISTPTTVQLYKKIVPSQTPINYLLPFAIQLNNNFAPTDSTHPLNLDKTLSSTSFFYNGNLSQLEDDGRGIIRVVNISGSSAITATNVGTINYTTGEVNLVQFTVDSFEGSNLLVFVTPLDDDITSNQNTIMLIEPSGVNLTVQQLQL